MKRYSGKLYCFSPPVMLATFLFEFASLFYILWRYKLTPVTRLSCVILAALGVFQLTEYMICGGLGLSGGEWARFGYISITLLPVLGIHLAATIAGKRPTLLLATLYGSMIAFVGFFALTPGAINSHECRPNYAVFNLDEITMNIYTLYYYGWLAVGTVLSLHWARQVPTARHALHWLCGGYLAFIIPTAAVSILNPTVTAGIPSIMCGFAVLLAIIIVGCVVPLQARRIPQKGIRAKSNPSF